MLTLIALLLALLVLPAPWGAALVAVAALADVAETVVLVRWSRRRRAVVGLGTLAGRTATVVTTLAPRGQVRVDGELWAARCTAAGAVAQPGDRVRIIRVEGLDLVVEPL